MRPRSQFRASSFMTENLSLPYVEEATMRFLWKTGHCYQVSHVCSENLIPTCVPISTRYSNSLGVLQRGLYLRPRGYTLL